MSGKPRRGRRTGTPALRPPALPTLAPRRAFRTCLLALVTLFCLLASPARATIIRDVEIEDMVKALAEPIFRAANLTPGDIDVYLVKSDVLNAFVAGGQNLFLNTGLVVRTETPEQLAGVIAHETGHIAGGHLSRLSQQAERATYQTLLGMVLGGLAAAAGAPEVGTALMYGGITVGQRELLAFSRDQERLADQAAISYLATLRLSPRGMLEFFRTLEGQNLRIAGEGNVFLRTHPLTRERIGYLETQLQQSPYRDRTLESAMRSAHARARAKLEAFLADPQAVLTKHTGDGFVDRYARAIALYRIPELGQALALVDQLVKERPDDPFLHELKGQMLFENGRIKDAIPPYREAQRLRPDTALIRFGLARAIMEQPGAKPSPEAASLLREAARIEPDNATVWRFLGIAEGQVGNTGAAELALTEAAVLSRQKREAERHLARAQQLVKPADPAWLRLQDLGRAVEDMEEPKPPPPPDRRRRSWP